MEFNITEEAKKKINQELKGQSIRVYPRRKAWSGIIYEWAQDEPKDDDNVYEVEGIKIIVNKSLEKSAHNIDIDYEHYDWGDDFVITTQF